jgi:hypothetical protein
MSPMLRISGAAAPTHLAAVPTPGHVVDTDADRAAVVGVTSLVRLPSDATDSCDAEHRRCGQHHRCRS